MSPKEKILINLNPKRISRILFFIILGLSIASLLGQFSRYFLIDHPLKWILIGLLDVDNENSIATFYSVFGLLFCSTLLFLIAYIKVNIPQQSYSRYWSFLSLIFLTLSFDEASSLHEKLVNPLRDAFNTSGIFYYAWVIPGIMFVIAFLVIFSEFIFHLPRRIKRLSIISGTIFISGALGMELISGFWASVYGENNFFYATLQTTEEFLEMLGIVVFIYTLMTYLRSLTHVLVFSLDD